MAMKKAKPMVAKRVADRKAFVEKTAGMASTPRSKQAARQKFFVQTRMKELEAKGKPVDAAKRKELRQKFQSGNVSRAGFGAPKKKAASSTASSTSKVTPKAMPKAMPKSSSRNATSQMKGVAGYGGAKSGTSVAGKGKSASQDINKRQVKPLYKNK
jgi:hypothetical protein